jgi:hypothetical protein
VVERHEGVAANLASRSCRFGAARQVYAFVPKVGEMTVRGGPYRD